MRVFISGQKYFGQKVLELCLANGHQVVGVCCPIDDRYMGDKARLFNIPIIPAGGLSRNTMPKDVDLGITAHSFDYVGKATRYATRLGWIGYHPSLLPRHRGRSSIEWALRFKDIVTGGTVYWLNDGVDRGDIAYQDWIWLDHSRMACDIWRDELLPLGLRLIDQALQDISAGLIRRRPQDSRFSTFEPSLENVKDLYRPDLLMLEAENPAE